MRGWDSSQFGRHSSRDNMLLTAAVIAGGEGRRFGGKKQNTLFMGKTLLSYATDTALRLTERVLVVDNGVCEDPVEGPDYLHDWKRGMGPLGGLVTAMRAAETQWVAVIPCDMPFLSPELYLTLWRNRYERRPVVAVGEYGIEPLVSIWPTVLEEAVTASLEKGNLSIRSLLVELHVRAVSIEKDISESGFRWYKNINRKDDLCCLRDVVSDQIPRRKG